jgi:hypothetical protein
MSQMAHNRLPPTPDDEPEERGRGERDIIYALRTAHQNQMQLIVLADQKANILIGLVAVMGTILFTKANVLAPLEEKFVIPFAGFLCLDVLTLVLALFVLLPTKIGRRKGKKSEEMANPLFFGGFTNFTEAEYVTFLSEQLTDDRAARLLLIKDLYSMGVVLKRKYRLLTYAYSFAALSVVFPVVFLVMSHFR